LKINAGVIIYYLTVGSVTTRRNNVTQLTIFLCRQRSKKRS